MENFKIRDFSHAFQVGIEKLVMDAINHSSKKKKNPEKIKLKKAIKIVKNDIFVRRQCFIIQKALKVASKETKNEDDEALKWILSCLIDTSKPQNPKKKPKI